LKNLATVVLKIEMKLTNSSLFICQRENKSLNWNKMFLNAITTILAKQAFGNDVNNGPMNKITNRRIIALYIELTSVFPPVDSTMLVLDKEPEQGKHKKNEPTKLDRPYAYNSYNKNE
jgi:hypothetical protein